MGAAVVLGGWVEVGAGGGLMERRLRFSWERKGKGRVLGILGVHQVIAYNIT